MFNQYKYDKAEFVLRIQDEGCIYMPINDIKKYLYYEQT